LAVTGAIQIFFIIIIIIIIAVQGHPRSSILVPVESAYNSY